MDEATVGVCTVIRDDFGSIATEGELYNAYVACEYVDYGNNVTIEHEVVAACVCLNVERDCLQSQCSVGPVIEQFNQCTASSDFRNTAIGEAICDASSMGGLVDNIMKLCFSKSCSKLIAQYGGLVDTTQEPSNRFSGAILTSSATEWEYYVIGILGTVIFISLIIAHQVRKTKKKNERKPDQNAGRGSLVVALEVHDDDSFFQGHSSSTRNNNKPIIDQHKHSLDPSLKTLERIREMEFANIPRKGTQNGTAKEPFLHNRPYVPREPQVDAFRAPVVDDQTPGVVISTASRSPEQFAKLSSSGQSFFANVIRRLASFSPSHKLETRDIATPLPNRQVALETDLTLDQTSQQLPTDEPPEDLQTATIEMTRYPTAEESNNEWISALQYGSHGSLRSVALDTDGNIHSTEQQQNQELINDWVEPIPSQGSARGSGMQQQRQVHEQLDDGSERAIEYALNRNGNREVQNIEKGMVVLWAVANILKKSLPQTTQAVSRLQQSIQDNTSTTEVLLAMQELYSEIVITTTIEQLNANKRKVKRILKKARKELVQHLENDQL